MYSIANPIARENRNVLVVGRTGAGKSAVANAILGTGEQFKVDHLPSRCTLEPEYKACEFDEGSVRYYFTVIDTIGTDSFDSITEKISNKKIMKKNKEAVKQFVDGLHLIIFVVKEGWFTDDDKATFDLVQKHFSKDIDPISALVITGCEGKDRNKIIEQYKEDTATKKTVEHMEKGIHPVGFPITAELSGPIKETLEAQAQDDAIQLRKLICHSCQDMYHRDKLYDNSSLLRAF